MDQENIQKNCYARFNDPETLTASKIFLKEKFYRTSLMTAGKIPFWTILPSQCDTRTYTALVKNISSIKKLTPVSNGFIDLDPVKKPGHKDILKRLLWHVCKARFDPGTLTWVLCDAFYLDFLKPYGMNFIQKILCTLNNGRQPEIPQRHAKIQGQQPKIGQLPGRYFPGF